MARVPTWTELRIQATKLAQTQKGLYRSVHDMLDGELPELDRKISLLMAGSPTNLTSSKLKSQAKPKPETAPALTAVPEQKQAVRSKAPSKQAPKKPTAQPDDRHPNNEIALRPTEMPKPNLDELEHLRPLPHPLSYYLKLKRPDLVREADRRVTYLKKKAERRKKASATRTINTLDCIRTFSSRSSSQNGASSLRSSLRTVSRENLPNYQVKCKLSEQEMKRLTARIYNRLPEVKKQRNEQVTKHMKVQNYKNKMDYGRKLLENRRQGIINYPLRTNYDDSSIMSSQEESLTNSLDQSADGKFDQYC